MPARVHVALSALLAAVCCQLAAAQGSSVAALERATADRLVLGREGASKAASDATGAPARSLPASAPKTVAERKAETLEAMRKGQLVPAGHGSPAQVP